MGRLPATFADRPIMDRDPYEMYGELSLAALASSTIFPSATFENNTDKPFEIHRMIPRFLALDAEGVALPTQPDQDLLAALVKIEMTLTDREQRLTKAPTRVFALTKGSAERTWEWADPEYLIRTNGITVAVSTVAFPVISNLSRILVCITFEGFMCVIAPPSNNR